MDHAQEAARLDALRQLGLLDSGQKDSFDRITRMASQIFGLPISAISLTDQDRQWFLSRVGVEVEQLKRETAPCSQVAEQVRPLAILDLLEDDYYRHSELAGTGARFYAGAPLVTRDGHGLGSLCVVGPEPRAVSEAEMAALADLAAMVMAQIELQHAFGRIDPLSGLPNRNQFLDDLADLARDLPGQRRLAVLLDLARPDQVDNIARVIGSTYVDEMVAEAARSLRSALPEGRTAYHVAGTQFAFIAPPDADDQAYVAQLAGLLVQYRAVSMVRFVTTVAIGVAPFVLGRARPADVLRQAHGAAQDARGSDTSVGFHSSENEGLHRRRFDLLQDFGAALASSDQLRLVYQPRVDLASSRCVGAEVLLRWTHPDLGEVSPGEFIPIVEQSSHAKPLTHWVLDRALAQLAAWQERGWDVPLSVNISASNLEEDDFAVRVQLLLLKHRIRPDQIELELTESTVMQNVCRAHAHLEQLHAAGVRVAIDDFGTGHSSLAYLQRLPADVVKIDQSFVRDMTLGEREHGLVRTMIRLSHDLGYRVVAEGVETREVARLLADMACDEAQGYHFARPLEAAAFVQWLAAAGGIGSYSVATA